MAWQKVKIRPEQELVVGGRRTGAGRALGLGALLVGVFDDGRLRYAGKGGAGFSEAVRGELLAALKPLAAAESPFTSPLPRPVSRAAIWVRPRLVVRAEFAGWTGDGLVRHAAYKGLDLAKARASCAERSRNRVAQADEAQRRGRGFRRRRTTFPCVAITRTRRSAGCSDRPDLPAFYQGDLWRRETLARTATGAWMQA